MQVGHEEYTRLCFKRISPPKDGTFLVLHPWQIANLDLLCMIRRSYPHTQIIAQEPMPRCVSGA